MERPPRDLSDPLFSKRTVGLSLLQGLFVMVIVLLVFLVGWWHGAGSPDVVRENEARAMTFAALVIANLGLILINRSWTRTIRSTLRTPNRALWYVFGGAIVFLGLVLYVPALQNLFQFSRLGPLDLGIAVVAGVFSVAWFEVLKIIQERRQRAAGLPPAED